MIEIVVYIVAFIGVGMGTYLVDEWRGVEWYSKLWSLFHKDPLSDKVGRGFICGRSVRDRVVPAAVLALVSCLLLRILGEHDFIILAFKGIFLMFPGILVGFTIMGFFRRNKTIAQHADKVFHAMDEFEAGKMDVAGMARDVAKDVADKASEVGEKVASFVKGDSPARSDTSEPSSEGDTKTTPPGVDSSRRTARDNFSSALTEFKKRH